jgi:DNA-binding transcriptional ArsR family regulator
VSIVLDLGGLGPADLVAGPSALSELMASLHVLAEPEHHPEAVGWTARAAAAGPELRDELSLFAPLWARYRCRLFFPRTLPLASSLDEELAAIAALPAEEFLELVAPGVLGTNAQPVPSARELRAGTAAAEDYARRCLRRSYARGELARQLVAAPLDVRDRLLAVLRAADTAFFAEDWRTLRTPLEDHAGEVRRRLAALPLGAPLSLRSPADVLTELLPTAARVGPGERVRLDKLQIDEVKVTPRPLVLVPSARVWPHLTVKSEYPWGVVVQYAVLGTTPAEQLTLRDLHHRLMALTSPARMELCRHLLGEPITTSELAARLGSSEPQVSRALRTLRDAGLVHSTRDGKLVRHRLATDVVQRLGHDVLATVAR